MPTIRIAEGKKVQWRKHWISGRVYTVTLPEKGGRTKFKEAHRDALAATFLEELRREYKNSYHKLMTAVGSGYGREITARSAITTIIQKGSVGAAKQFGKDASTPGQGFDKLYSGKVGIRVCETLGEMGFSW